jgi:hypothetical protein
LWLHQKRETASEVLPGQPFSDARYHARTIGLAPRAPFEPEARWLLAQTIEQFNKPEEAKRELAKLVKSGLNDAFIRKARAKLENPNK